jgi:predicted DNA-binding ribbon-helix-helix protein
MTAQAPGAVETMGVTTTGSTLVSRNVTVAGRRTSIRLEPVMWRALEQISARQNISVFEFCTRVHERRLGGNLTAGVRAEIVSYLLENLAMAETRLSKLAGQAGLHDPV